VAVTIAIRCEVAVRFSGVPGEIVNQSASPARAVGTVKIKPRTSASHQPCAAPFSATPTMLAKPSTAAAV
jgi:hypothetical protein